MRDLILDKTIEYYETKEAQLGPETLHQFERMVMLRTIDTNWMGHLEAMDELKEGIGLRAYGQNDPLIAYKIEAYQMFKEMRDAINEEVVRLLTKVQVSTEERFVQRPRLKNVMTNISEDGTPAVQQRVAGNKVGRNDPCPCGSGKKYKKCCGLTAN